MGRRISSSTYRVLSFIIRYKNVNKGQSPSIREICQGCAFHSSSQGHYHLMRLEALGLIDRYARRPRSIRLIGEQWVLPEERDA
jgi:SOS-response transcriptional repressor LexA